MVTREGLAQQAEELLQTQQLAVPIAHEAGQHSTSRVAFRDPGTRFSGLLPDPRFLPH